MQGGEVRQGGAHSLHQLVGDLWEERERDGWGGKEGRRRKWTREGTAGGRQERWVNLWGKWVILGVCVVVVAATWA